MGVTNFLKYSVATCTFLLAVIRRTGAAVAFLLLAPSTNDFTYLTKPLFFVLCKQFLMQRLPIFRLDYLTTTPSSLRGNRRRKSFTTDNWSAIQLVTLWNVPFVLFLIQIQTKWYCCRMSVNFCR